LRRNHIGSRGQQKNVIESKGLGNGKMNHKISRESPSRAGDDSF
jgi:hypothetical protein